MKTCAYALQLTVAVITAPMMFFMMANEPVEQKAFPASLPGSL
jgi:hypothetical protein